MPHRARPNVLVVEDDALVRTFVRFALERGGLDVVEAETGGDALRLAGAGEFDAVMVDGLLPDMHGVELATRLLDDTATAGLPICFLSGAVQARSRPMVAGFGCLIKPVRPTDLVTQIETLLLWRDDGGSPLDERREALRRLENGFLVGP
jgi:DNA-binding response OmpR family regulator